MRTSHDDEGQDADSSAMNLVMAGDHLAKIADEAADHLGGLANYVAAHMIYDRDFQVIYDHAHCLKDGLHEAITEWQSAKKASGND